MSADSSSVNVPAKPAEPAPGYPWSPFSAIVLVLVSFIVVPVVAQLALAFYPILLGWSGERIDSWLADSTLANFLYVLFTETVTVGVLYWFVARRKKTPFRPVIGLGALRWRDIVHAVLGFVAYIVLFVAAYAVINQYFPLDTESEQELGFQTGVRGSELAMAFISLVVLVPAAEEIVFRGFIYGTLRGRRYSALAATLVTSAVFAALHLFGSDDGSLLWIAFVDVFALSVITCFLREKNGTIWASIGVHALKNGLTFLNLFVIAVS
jgi:membrane protease YdiL (CAAX protease family)